MRYKDMSELLNELLEDYSKKPRKGKEKTIKDVLKLCPIYTHNDFLITVEKKIKGKYWHLLPIYTTIDSEDLDKRHCDIKGMLDVVNFIRENNIEYDEYKIDGIIIHADKTDLVFSFDELCEYNYEHMYSEIENITWLNPRPTIKLNKTIGDYLSNFDNKLELGTEFDVDDNVVSLDVKPSELAIIGGRPCMGKTAVAISYMINEAIHNDGTILYLSFDLSTDDLTKRIINTFSHTGILHTYETTNEIFTKMDISTREIRKKNIYLQDCAFFNIDEVVEIIESNLEKIKPTTIIIDYLQLMNVGNESLNNKNVESTMLKLKEIARKTNTKMIVLSQLNRNLEKRKDKHPKISDILVSPKIGEMADKVYMLHREDYYRELIFDSSRQIEITKVKPCNHTKTDVYMFESGYIR